MALTLRFQNFGLQNCELNFIKYKFIYLFIYFWLHWVFVAARGQSLVAPSRGYSLSWCEGISLWWLLFVEEHRL